MGSSKRCASGHELLWAPWRLEYIESADQPKGCIFCIKVQESDDRKNLIVYRGKHAFVILNRFPYNNGHVMIAPYKHIAEFSSLSDQAKLELIDLLSLTKEVLDQVMRPHGFNIGINLGRSAGAGIEDHLHIHVVPRWNGDTNFMPILANTKVIPESLDKTWMKLSEGFKELKNRPQNK